MINLVKNTRRQDIKKIAVIISSSRAGSSLLFNQLSKFKGIYSLQGEETPCYRLENIGWIKNSEDSDQLLPQQVPAAAMDAIFSRMMGDLTSNYASYEDNEPNRAQFNSIVLNRLIHQWPKLADKKNVLGQAINNISNIHNFNTEILETLKSLGCDINIYDGVGTYDCKVNLPAENLYEEPPYILPVPRGMLATNFNENDILLLKTSTNAYRIPLLKAFFPNASFKWVLLTRHPFGTINGLNDGWLSPWFYSHNLESIAKVQMSSYTENWWKFDAPPGWYNYINSDLSAACAFQWTSAYYHILENLSSADDKLIVTYEDLIGENQNCFVNLYKFLELTPQNVNETINLSKKIMSTKNPSPNRWKKSGLDWSSIRTFPNLEQIAKNFNYNLDI